MKIQEPQLKSFRRSLADLHNAMKPTHSSLQSFQRFKKNARLYMKPLDTTKPKSAQGIQEWRKFVQEMLFVEPKLRCYENNWPLEAYFNSFTRRIKYKIKQRKTTPDTSEVEFLSSPEDLEVVDIASDRDDNSQVQHSISRNASVLPFYGSFISTGLRMRQRQSTPSQSTPVAFLPSSCSAPTQTRPTSMHASTSRLTNSAPIHRTNGTQFLATRIPATENSLTTVVSACVFCNPCEKVDTLYNPRLREFVRSDTFIQILASVGVYFDQHLELLLRFSSARRKEFFDDIPLDLMDAFTKYRLLKLFRDDPTDGKSDLNKTVWIPYISRPPAQIEENLVNPNNQNFVSQFQRAMILSDEVCFPDILKTMLVKSDGYSLIHFPNTEQLRQTIFKISEGMLDLFGRYENFWPIRIYLKRQKFLVGACPKFTEEEEEEVFAAAFTDTNRFGSPKTQNAVFPSSAVPASIRSTQPATMHPGFNVAQVPCKLHLPVDVSRAPPKLRAHLHRQGLGELLPALVSVGINTDSDFADFCQMSDEERTRVMEFGKLKLNQLQKFLLKVAFQDN